MSNETLLPEPSDKTVLLSALGWIGVILVFGLVVAVAYLPNRAVSQESRNVEIRMKILNDVRGEQARLVNAYEWVNQPEGVVRIPVERAMKLAVEELRAKQLPLADPSN
ncbi:MAG TPA: hypothetical protein VK995_03285 [Oceanipulchritudo sp.]|nr:hypothetical protein [Oceanipulchritudo sp.]